jgi:hypothetical protein
MEDQWGYYEKQMGFLRWSERTRLFGNIMFVTYVLHEVSRRPSPVLIVEL